MFVSPGTAKADTPASAIATRTTADGISAPAARRGEVGAQFRTLIPEQCSRSSPYPWRPTPSRRMMDSCGPDLGLAFPRQRDVAVAPPPPGPAVLVSPASPPCASASRLLCSRGSLCCVGGCAIPSQSTRLDTGPQPVTVRLAPSMPRPGQQRRAPHREPRLRQHRPRVVERGGSILGSGFQAAGLARARTSAATGCRHGGGGMTAGCWTGSSDRPASTPAAAGAVGSSTTMSRSGWPSPIAARWRSPQAGAASSPGDR